MKKTFMIAFSVVGMLSLLGCGDRGERLVKNEVRAQLVDPDSAKFRNIRIFENGNYCGEVNAKNRMGGYSGFVEFSKTYERVELGEKGDFNISCRYAEIPLLLKCDLLMTSIQLRNKEEDRKEFADVFCESLMQKSNFKR